MPQVQMDIPEELINEAADGKIKELQRKLDNAEKREERLKEKLAGKEQDMVIAADIISRFKGLIDDYSYDLDVYIGEYA